MSEDLQSSRRKFDLEHSEGDLRWSQSQSDGRKGRVECRWNWWKKRVAVVKLVE